MLRYVHCLHTLKNNYSSNVSSTLGGDDVVVVCDCHTHIIYTTTLCPNDLLLLSCSRHTHNHHGQCPAHSLCDKMQLLMSSLFIWCIAPCVLAVMYICRRPCTEYPLHKCVKISQGHCWENLRFGPAERWRPPKQVFKVELSFNGHNVRGISA